MIIVYTTIFGGSDSLKPAPSGADRAVCFVDDPARYPETKGWELIRCLTDRPRRYAWHMRCVPDLYFDTYDRVIWIDASFTLTDLPRLLQDAGDADIAALRHHKRLSCYDEAFEIVKVGQAPVDAVARQMQGYRAEGYPGKPLSISCVLVRARNDRVQAFNETWDQEITKHPGDNTQLSLDYSAWKHGLLIHALKGTRHENPYAVHDHSDHKKRRKPYDTAA